MANFSLLACFSTFHNYLYKSGPPQFDGLVFLYFWIVTLCYNFDLYQPMICLLEEQDFFNEYIKYALDKDEKGYSPRAIHFHLEKKCDKLIFSEINNWYVLFIKINFPRFSPLCLSFWRLKSKMAAILQKNRWKCYKSGFFTPFLQIFMTDKLKQYNLASVVKFSEKMVKNYKSNMPLT